MSGSTTGLLETAIRVKTVLSHPLCENCGLDQIKILEITTNTTFAETVWLCAECLEQFAKEVRQSC